MNAFGQALNLVFMRGSGDFSSGSMPMEWISDCIPMSSSSYSLPMDSRLWMHSHEFKFLFHANGLNLRLHSHEFLFEVNESQNAFHEFEFLFEVNESQTAFHEFLSPCQIFGVFWLGTTHILPSYFRNARRSPKKLHSGAILGVPLTITHGYP